MTAVLLVLEIFLLGTVGFVLVYLVGLSLVSLFARRKKSFPSNRRRTFAVVIPAHNEELGIANTLKSVSAIAYPSDLFDIVVIADNCTDRTAEIVRACGVTVLERSNSELRGKGHALRWAFDRLLPDQRYEAFAVIDADTATSVNFLEVMNHYLDQGANVVQSTDIVAPQEGPWNLEMIRIGFLLHNYIRPLARKVLGCPTILHGNGMCFSRTVLERMPWDAYSLAEDVEYGLRLLLGGFPAIFAPEAVVHAVMPQQQSNAQSQRVRWESGRFRLIRKYSLPLLRGALGNKSVRTLDVFMELVIPTLVNTMGLSILALLFSIAAVVLDPAISPAFVGIWSMLVVAGFIHVFVGLYSASAPRFTYLALLRLPHYAFWKVVTLAKNAFHGKGREWVRTTREAHSVREAENPRNDSQTT